MRLLVVGSTTEAAMAIHGLTSADEVEQIFHLPTQSKGLEFAVFSKRSPCPEGLSEASRSLKRCLIRDRWGKKIFGFGLAAFEVHELSLTPKPHPKLETLAEGLELNRTRACEGTMEIGLSDGSDLLCDGVIFADGAKSRGLALGKKREDEPDPGAVGCWSFVRDDLLDLTDWRFQSASAKSVEQLPLPGNKVRVSLRFRSGHGTQLSPEELKPLFSEFGSDMEALFEGVDPERIHYREERAARCDFQPLPGCLALGEAALGRVLLDGFDWRQRLLGAQMEALRSQIGQGTWETAPIAKVSGSAAVPLLNAEAFFRSSLHYDNALFRPLRDFLLSILPDALAGDKVRTRLALTS